MALSKEEQAAVDALNGKPAKAPATAPTTPTPKPQAGPGPLPLSAIAKKVAPENPFLPLVPVLTGAARGVGTGVGKVFDVLNRPSAANQARILRGPKAGVQTLIHSESPEQYQADTAEIARRDMANDRAFKLHPLLPSFGPHVGPTMTKEQYDKMPGWWHLATEMVTQMRHDPTTYIGGAGILEHLADAVGTRSFLSFVRATEAMQKSENPAIRQAGAGLAHAYDVTHHKGAVQRSLAAANGQEGIHQFRGLRAINNARKTKAQDLTNTLLDQYEDVIGGLKARSPMRTALVNLAASKNAKVSSLGKGLLKNYADITGGLKPQEEALLYRRIHEGRVDLLPENLQMRAAKFKGLTDSLAHLSGTEELQAGLKAHEFELDPNLQRFQSETPRDLQGAGSYRPHYVPTRHEAESAVEHLNKGEGSMLSLDQPATAAERNIGSARLRDLLQSDAPKAKVSSSVEREDPFLKQRAQEGKMEPTGLQRRIITARIKSGAQAIAAHDAEQQVAKLFGKESWSKVPADAKAYFQETYNEPGGKEFWTGLAKGAIDIPKIGLFALPFRHSFNIATLQALADPGALPGTLGNYAYLMTIGTDSKRLSNLAGKVGAKKVSAFLDPAAAAARKSKALGKAEEYGVTRASSIDRRAASGWLGKIPGLGDIYKASNHMLWTFDDAAKATRFNRLLRKYRTEGMDESHAAIRAADQTGAELIDYSNNSPLTETLRYIAPFATYRSKAPLAVLGSVGRHPERTLVAGRASPELIGDTQQGPPDTQGKPRVGKSYLPLAETLRGIENPVEFARSTVGYPFALGASAIGGAVQKAAGISQPDVAYYMTYGKDPDLKYLANSVIGSFPGGEAALGAAGLGEFANQGSLSGAVRGQTGFGLSRGPSPTQIVLPAILEKAQEQEAKARGAGDKTTADAIAKAIERVRERYRLYVP